MSEFSRWIIFSAMLFKAKYSKCRCTRYKIHVTRYKVQGTRRTPSRQEKQNQDPLVQCSSESCVSLVQLLTLLVLWASWKELKEQVCFMACPEKCVKGLLCPKCLLVLWTSKQELTVVPHLSHLSTLVSQVDVMFFAPWPCFNFLTSKWDVLVQRKGVGLILIEASWGSCVGSKKNMFSGWEKETKIESYPWLT